VKVFYTEAYCDTSVAWDTTRKAAAVARSLIADPVDGVELLEPAQVSDTALEQVLEPAYFRALVGGAPESLAESNGIGWDERLLGAVRASTGGVCAAVIDALVGRRNAGSLSSGLHHARPERGSGFCTVNGLAVGAAAAFEHGAERVLVVDLDAHAGGGTAAYLPRPGFGGLEQIDVSVIAYDTYSGVDRARLVLSEAGRYLADVERALTEVVSPGTVDVVLYNAGMDPCDRAGGVAGVTREMLAQREALMFSWAASHGAPVAWVLAGGYTTGMGMEELAGLHRMTVEAAA
jgi:acetoin utilization deacetylase AcuC-like enzyme